MQVCKYARGHLGPEQRGRLIGKGPLPKEKLMKALGEVFSHCEIFCHKNCTGRLLPPHLFGTRKCKLVRKAEN